MKKLHLILLSCLLTAISCNKNDGIIQSFTGNLPIASTISPTTAIAGQNIISNVRCELSSLSGTVTFQGFYMKEVATRQFNINAKAFYKDWNTQIGTPIIWMLDTTLNIKTKIA